MSSAISLSKPPVGFNPQSVSARPQTFLSDRVTSRGVGLGLFILTLSLRLIASWLLYLSPYALPASGDPKFYSDWALRIAGGRVFEGHAFYGQPLYAYLTGGVFALAGYHPVLLNVMQSVLDAVTALLIYKIALLVFGESTKRACFIAVTAALGWAFFVAAAAYCILLVSTSWVVAAWWFCVWWILRRAAVAKFGEWFLIALLAGTTAMMSAAILFVVPIFLVAAFARRSFALAVAVGLGVVFGVAPSWAVNKWTAGDPVLISAHSGLNFWIGNNPEADGYPTIPHALPSEQSALLTQSIAIAEAEAGVPLPRSAVSHYWSRKARHYIGQHFGDWLRLLGLKMRNFWNGFVYDDLSSITLLREAGVVPAGLSFGMVALFALPGCIVCLWQRRAGWLLATIALQMIALLPVFVNERYRLAAVPGLLILGSFFLAFLWEALQQHNWPTVSWTAVLILVSAWFITLPPPQRNLSSLDDYKTARKQLAVADFDCAEPHLRRAFTQEAGAAQVNRLLAATYAEEALNQLQAGRTAPAWEAANRSLRFQPNDAFLQTFLSAAMPR